MTVSIIIPAHNAEAVLAQTIESALNQTWPETEIIVVDDKSTDETRAVADRYASAGVIVMSTPEGRSGACAARNVGLDHADGDCIQYLDADDLMSSDKIETQLRVLQQCPERTVASCPWGKFESDPEDTQMEQLAVFGDFAPTDWLITAWQGGGMIQTACWLTPRRVAEATGPWDESLKSNPADDGEYFSRVLLHSSGIRFCETARVYYRMPQDDNVSQNMSDEAVRSLFLTCEHYCQQILPVEDSPRVRKALARNYAVFAYRFFSSHRSLADRALGRIGELAVGPPATVGGSGFRRLSRLLGFERALRLRAKLRQ